MGDRDRLHPGRPFNLVSEMNTNRTRSFAKADRHRIRINPWDLTVNKGGVYGHMTYAHSFYKYFVPSILLVLIILNIFMVYAIVRQMKGASSMQKASYALLIAFALSNTLTVAATIPGVVYMYVMKASNGELNLPYESCSTMANLERLPNIPHMTSIWLTVAMAGQRYICVLRPFTAGSWVSLKSSGLTILCVIAASVCFNLPRFMDIEFDHILFYAGIRTPRYGKPASTCKLRYKDWLKNPKMYEIGYMLTSTVMLQFIPCILVIVFGALMFKALKQSINMLKTMDRKACVRTRKRTQLSVFVMIAAGFLCSVEIPSGVLQVIIIIQLIMENEIVPKLILRSGSFGLNIVLYSSYCCVFVIYCLMSGTVRKTLRSGLMKLFGTKCH